MKLYLSLFFAITMCSGFQSLASDFNNKPLQKFAVFPIFNAPAATADEAWWQIRESLTKNKVFLVASRRLMVNRGVFVNKEDLRPSETIILGKILEADAVWISAVENRRLNVKVYETETGTIVWEKSFEFHPTIPIKDQIVKISTDAVATFQLQMPYQGVQVAYDNTGKHVDEKEGKVFARIKAFVGAQIKVGDEVHWIRLENERRSALFSDTTQIIVVAKGIVTEKTDQNIVAEVSASENLQLLKEDALIRFPIEARLAQEKLDGENKAAELSHEYLSAEIKKTSDIKKQNSSTTTSLAMLLNIATFILLAF